MSEYITKKMKTNVAVLGALGQNGMNRIRHALRKLICEQIVNHVIFVDIKPCYQTSTCVMGLLPGDITYVRIKPTYLLPIASLLELNPEDHQLYTIITTPTKYHAPYALQAATHSKGVIVEKPFTCKPEELIYFIENAFTNCWPADHYLCKKAMRYALNVIRNSNHKRELLDAALLEFDLLEQCGIGSRQIEDVLWDLFWHIVSCFILLVKSAGYVPKFTITRVRVARYRDEMGNQPDQWTAASIEGVLDIGGRTVRFFARVGKGTGQCIKKLVIRYVDGKTSAIIPLSESGFTPHLEMLRMFITERYPKFALDLRDALQAVNVCAEASAKAKEERSYPFGSIPDLLKGGIVSTSSDHLHLRQWALPIVKSSTANLG